MDTRDPPFRYHNDSRTVVQNVDFDVALTISSESGTKGGIGVVGGVLNLGSSGESSKEKQAVCHLKLSVPLLLPAGKDLADQ